MREFKFRAWDKKAKKMVYVSSVTFWVGSKIIGLGASLLQKRLGWEEDFEIMQYTGLKDKNGKEIYEGDICVCKYNNRVDSIKWDHGKWQFSSEDCLECFNAAPALKLEVIGNIYENPDLIKLAP